MSWKIPSYISGMLPGALQRPQGMRGKAKVPKICLVGKWVITGSLLDSFKKKNALSRSHLALQFQTYTKIRSFSLDFSKNETTSPSKWSEGGRSVQDRVLDVQSLLNMVQTYACGKRASAKLSSKWKFRKISMNFKAKRSSFSRTFSLVTLDGYGKVVLALGMTTGSSTGLLDRMDTYGTIR
ncbi:hypothetical protein Tco_0565773 [Tanacetum coccineum]